MNSLWAIVRKDFQLLLTDKVTLFFTFVFPLLFAGLFGNMMGGGGSKQIKVAVVQQDQTAAATAFVQTLNDASELKVQTMALEQAQNAVRKGDLTAYIVIPEGFGERYDAVFAGKAPTLIVGVDPKRTAEAGLLEGVLMKYGADRFTKLFSSSDAMREQMQKSLAQIQAADDMPAAWRDLLNDYLPKIEQLLAEQPAVEDNTGESGFDGFTPLNIEKQEVIREQKGPGHAQAVFFPQAIMWATLGCIMGFGTSLVQEYSRGTMLRLRAAPITTATVLAGKSLTCAVTIAIVIGTLLIVGRTVFGMPIETPALLALAITGIAVCFSGLMMLFAAIAKTEQALNGLGWAVLMVFAMIGGAMLPLFLMPEWLQNVSHFSPVKWGILALEGAIWRGFDVQEMLKPVAILLSLGLIAYGIGLQRIKSLDAAG